MRGLVRSCLPQSIKAVRGGLPEEGACKLTPDIRDGHDASWSGEARQWKEVMGALERAGLVPGMQDTL